MKRIALFVGINTYPESPLRCARADAETLYREFRGKYDAAKLLVDRDASPERIADEIENFQKVLSPGDMFLFYFSGHGCEQEGSRFIAVPQYDVQGNPLELAGLTINAFKDMTDIKGLHRLFVLDCCRNVLRSVEDVGARGKMAGYLHRHGSRSIIQPTILSSSAPGQTSYEHVESGHGYFTEAFLAAIRSPEVRSFNMFRDRLDFEMQSLRTPATQDPYFEGGIGSNLPIWPDWCLSVNDDVHHVIGQENPSASKTVTLGDVVDAFKGAPAYSFYIGGNIPEKKRRNAWNSMRVNGYDTSILALFDSTLWGGAREGIAITPEGIHAKSLGKEPTFHAWNDIETVTLYNSHLVLNGQEAGEWYCGDNSEAQKICDAITKLVNKVKENYVQESAQQQPATLSATPLHGQGYANQQTLSSSSCRSRFHLTVEDTFNIEAGYVLTGVVRGASVRCGDKVEILRWGKSFCTATIAGIERQATLVDTGSVGDLVGLLIQPDRKISFFDLEPGMVLRPFVSGVNRHNNHDKRRIPCRRKKSDYSHVLKKNNSGGLAPEPGYAWLNSNSAGDYRVIWKPGFFHPDIPNVVASEVEGFWVPAVGYTWASGNGAETVRQG